MSSVRIETFHGQRETLRDLFELAEDSPSELAHYLDLGRVLVARTGSGEIVGHLQLVDTGEPGRVELKNMAVAEPHQGRGVGRALVGAALEQEGSTTGATTVVVATAAADIGNLRFYQRLGFRLRSIERDVFTPAAGYPAGTLIDGIELLDRVWLDQNLHPESTP